MKRADKKVAGIRSCSKQQIELLSGGQKRNKGAPVAGAGPWPRKRRWRNRVRAVCRLRQSQAARIGAHVDNLVRGVCSFPKAAITEDHKLGSLQ